MIDEAESFVTAAKLLKERGAYKILVMVTHGLLSANAPELIEESVIDEVWYFVSQLVVPVWARCPRLGAVSGCFLILKGASSLEAN